MKNKRVFALSMAALLCASSMTVFAKSAMDAIWEDIEAGYYGNLPKSSKAVNDSILEGSRFIPGTAVKIYETPLYLGTRAGLNDFVSTAEKDGVFSCIADSGKFCVQVTGPNDPVPGTAIVEANHVEQVLEADKGHTCRLNLDENCQNRLTSAKMNLKETTAYYTIFDGLLTGVLFTDGKNEMVQVMFPAKAVYHETQAGEMFTKEEFLRFIREHEAELTQYEGTTEGLGTDKLLSAKNVLTAENIKTIYNSYYKEIPVTYTKNDSRNVLDRSSFVEKNSVGIDISTKEGQSEFFAQYEKTGSLEKMARSSNLYYALCDQKGWGAGIGTAIVEPDGRIKQVFAGDNGAAYALNIDEDLRKQLEDSDLNFDTTTAMFLGIPMYAEGILLTDGVAEYYLPKNIRGGKLEIDRLYSVSSVLDDISANSEDILYESVVLGEEHRDEDGRYSPPTGGGMASSATVAAKGASMGSVWDKMEAGYYRNLPVDTLIPGIQVVPGTAVRLYRSAEFLGTKNKAEDFIRTVEKKGVIASLVPDAYLSLAGNAENPRADTIIVDGEHFGTILPWDGGACYRFDLSSADRETLRKSELDLKKTKAYFIELNGLLTGIVFTDGSHEMVQVKQPGEAYPGLEAGKVCTPKALIQFMRGQMGRLPADEGTVGWAGTDKPDPAVGETDNANVRTEPFANVWEKLEDVYYKEEPFRDPDRVLPSGGHMIPHTTVHVYTVRDEFNLETGEGLDAFLETAEKRGLLSALSRTGCYTQAEIPASPDLSTLYVDDIEHSVIDVYPGDKGERCRLNLENPTKAVLGLTGINLMRANAHYFTLPEILTGTLFTSTDGDLGEWVQVREAGEAAKGILRPGEWYTAGEFVQLLRDHRAELIGGDPSMPPKSNPIT